MPSNRDRYAVHRATAAELVLQVLRDHVGQWLGTAEIHALARGQGRIGPATVRTVLIGLERDGVIESQRLSRSLGMDGMRQWRLRAEPTE